MEAASTNGVGGNGVEFSVHLVLFLGEGFCQKEEAGGGRAPFPVPEGQFRLLQCVPLVVR